MPAKRRFTSKEISLFKALVKGRVPFLVVGLSAASLQGAPVVTQDIDLWVKDLANPKFQDAVRGVGGFYVPPFGLNPPQIGGKGLELFDLVLNMDGLRSFSFEYKRSCKMNLGSLAIRVLPLERILRSKRAAGRKKDRAALPVLEDSLKALRSQVKR